MIKRKYVGLEKKMRLFDKLFKKEESKATIVKCEDNEVIAMADGRMIDLTTVSDATFAEKIMGDGVAFEYDADSVTFGAPANGTLSAIFTTGHAYGITMNNGVELMVHIGIDTVSSNGDGFQLLGKKQGQKINAGEAIVKVDMARLRDKYDMTTMLIITNPNGKQITIPEPKDVKYGEVLYSI